MEPDKIEAEEPKTFNVLGSIQMLEAELAKAEGSVSQITGLLNQTVAHRADIASKLAALREIKQAFGDHLIQATPAVAAEQS
jgi:hypothetical protein